MDQDWFEMTAERKRKLNSAVWIPLRADHRYESTGRAGFVGFKNDYLGVRTLAAPRQATETAEKLGWMEIGNSHQHRPHSQNDSYQPADAFTLPDDKSEGIHLVLYQHLNRLNHRA
jgi:hypothetical protein